MADNLGKVVNQHVVARMVYGIQPPKVDDLIEKKDDVIVRQEPIARMVYGIQLPDPDVIFDGDPDIVINDPPIRLVYGVPTPKPIEPVNPEPIPDPKPVPKPEPVKPEPVKPEPKPDPVKPEPNPDPVKPDPVKPEPKPDPVKPKEPEKPDDETSVDVDNNDPVKDTDNTDFDDFVVKKQKVEIEKRTDEKEGYTAPGEKHKLKDNQSTSSSSDNNSISEMFSKIVRMFMKGRR